MMVELPSPMEMESTDSPEQHAIHYTPPFDVPLGTFFICGATRNFPSDIESLKLVNKMVPVQ